MNKKKEYNKKHMSLFPYSNICQESHAFEIFGSKLRCKRCKWVKHEEEIEGELYLAKRLERIRSRPMIKESYVDLFNF